MAATGALAAGLVGIVQAIVASRVESAVVRRTDVVALTMATIGLVGLSVGVTVVDGRFLPNSLSVQGGPSVGVLTDRAIAEVAKVAPQGPFELVMGGTASVGRSSVAYPAVAYGLVARGLPVRLPFVYAVGADASRTATGSLPVVRVDISTQRPTVQVEQPRGSPTRKSVGLP